ncbi:MAG: ABC transporter permease [Thermomicrobiales bacterium]|nr:ABC transporter permease [Thermomicrobiales bacterium]
MSTAVSADRAAAGAGGVRSLASQLWGLGPLLALILASAYFATQSDRFLTGPNLSLVVQQSLVVGVLAIGQTLIILTAGIDLSCGAVMALASVVMARVAVVSGVNPFVALLLGILVAVLFGLANGALITKFDLPPFIVTLGTLNIAFAITHIYSQNQTITRVPSLLSVLGNTFRLGGTSITYGTVVMFALYLVAWYVLRQTAAGRHVYAVGDNPEAARRSGINTARLLIYVYVIAGLLYGIAGWVSIGRTGAGDPNAGQTDNLASITAVVLGGTSLFGGRGRIMGTLIGVLIVGVFRNGLQLIGVESVYQVLITGVLVILAVIVDQFARRRQL